MKKLNILIFLTVISLLLLISLYKITHNTITINLNYLNNTIAKQLSSIFPNSEINVKKTSLSWKKSDENFVLLSQNISIVNKDTNITINIPEFFLHSQLGLFFLWEHFNFSSIMIPNLNIKIGKSLKYNPINQEYFIQKIKHSITNMFNHNMTLKINNIIITTDNNKQYFIDKLSLKVYKKYDKDILNIAIKNNDSYITINALENYKDILKVSAKYHKVNIDLLNDIGIMASKFAIKHPLDFTGDFECEINEKNVITKGNINIKELNGSIIYLNSKIYTIDSLKANLKYKDNIINLIDLKSKIDDMNVYGLGYIDLKTQNIDFKFNIDKINVNNLSNYWTKDLYTFANTWYNNNVTSGSFSNIDFIFNTTIKKLWNDKDFSDTEIKADMHNIITKFHNDFEPLNIISGVLKIKKQSLLIEINNATLKQINTDNIIIKIDDINNDDSILEIYGDAKSTATQVYNLYDIYHIKFDKKLTSGNASSTFNFKIFNINNNNATKIFTDFQSKITSLNIVGLFDNFNINNSTLDINIHNEYIKIQGNGSMNNNPIHINISKNLNDNKISSYDISGYFLAEDIKALNLFKYKEFNGGVFANIKYFSNKENKKQINANIDLSTFALNFPYLNFLNHENNNMDLTIYFSDEKNLDLKRATIKGNNVDIEFSGQISDTVDLFFNKIHYFNNDILGHLKYTPNSLVIDINGNFLDLSKSKLSFKNKIENFSFDNIKINTKVNKVLAKNNIILNAFKMNLNYSDNSYKNSYLIGYFENNIPLKINHSEIGLEVFTEDAGSFFKSINMLNSIKNGKLSFYLYPLKKGSRMDGMFSLTKFNIVNASILTQILTLSSLKGIANVLNGQGIYFNSFNIPFSYNNGIVKLANSWMEGSELGISLSGSMNIIDQYFDLRGQIIPAYIINKAIWNIPIIGTLLTGGYSRGIIAIDYKITGNINKNYLSINPISILAPNLLKRILTLLNNKFLNIDKISSKENNKQST